MNKSLMDLVYGMMSISQLLAFPHTLLIVFVCLFTRGVLLLFALWNFFYRKILYANLYQRPKKLN